MMSILQELMALNEAQINGYWVVFDAEMEYESGTEFNFKVKYKPFKFIVKCADEAEAKKLADKPRSRKVPDALATKVSKQFGVKFGEYEVTLAASGVYTKQPKVGKMGIEVTPADFDSK